MPSIAKHSLIFTFNPDILDGAVTPPHLGGWTENYWYPNPLTLPQLTVLANARAQMLSYDCAITGYRITPYTYTINRMLPGPSQAGVMPQQGSFDQVGTNSPEDVLRISCKAGTTAAWTMFLHAIPDALIESNQFLPTRNFVRLLGQWIQDMKGAQQVLNVAMYWVGRDKTQPSVRVLSVNPIAGTIVTQAATGGVAGTNFIRLHRVYDDAGRPITGSFFITAGPVAGVGGIQTYTVQGLPNQTCTVPRGTCRNDLINSAPLTFSEANILSERKAGRPTLLFRGRRSKQRV